MKYSKEHKHRLFKILKEDLQLSREEIILFLKISDSTYDKMLSVKVDREIPQKTQHFLETILNTEDWDEICKEIINNKEKLKKMLKCKMKLQKNEYNQNFLKKNIDLFHEIVLNERLSASDDDFEYLTKLFASEYFIDKLLSAMRITKFHTTGLEEVLEEKDDLFLGFFSATSNPEKYQETCYDLRKVGSETRKKVLQKFEDSELFIFDKKEGSK